MNRETAKRLMQHLAAYLADRSGVRWDADTMAEIDELVDALIDAAKEEIEAEQEANLNNEYKQALLRERMMAGMS